jgi:hypothetical protein
VGQQRGELARKREETPLAGARVHDLPAGSQVSRARDFWYALAVPDGGGHRHDVLVDLVGHARRGHGEKQMVRDGSAQMGNEVKSFSRAWLVRLTQGQQADGDSDNANADEKDDDWGHGGEDYLVG